uniref:DNA-directed DNA polymerase n=1 Tax=viral metagenome TaxID=1070528 RepID=A0A6C0C801_9ZZZZ
MTQFQILDISSDDIEKDGEEPVFIITLYGKTNIVNKGFNKNIVCHIEGFKPFFYLKYPNSWTNSFIKSSFFGVRYLNIEGYIHDLSNSKLPPKSKEFYGYHLDENFNEKEFKFIKLEFINYDNMKKSIREIKKYCGKYYQDININKIKNDTKDKIIEFINLSKENEEYRFDSNLYESNIHPILRFIHETNIKPCGWVEIISGKEVDGDKKRFNVDIEYKYLDIKYLKPIDKNEINKFIIASFDIECDSSHGDFPNPKKDFRKLCINIVDRYKLEKPELDNTIIKCVVKWLNLAELTDGDIYIDKIHIENGPISKKSIDNMVNNYKDEICRLLKDSIIDSKLREFCVKELNNIFCKLKNDENEQIIVKGDPIIQIGTVFHKYGDKEPYDRSIVVIGPQKDMDENKICNDLDNINVYRCNTEKELLLKWKDLMLKHNPDYITGYNIFGFDFDYIIKRVESLFKCESSCKFNYFTKSMNHKHSCESHMFYKLGRLMKDNNKDYFNNIELSDPPVASNKKNPDFWTYKEKRCKTVTKRLGNQNDDEDSDFMQNTLKYIHMDGRIIFDVQNEIKKGTSLDSYKLDNVSSHFMRGKIIGKKRCVKVNITYIETNNIGNLKIGDYISISILTKYGEMKYNNGEKFIILDVKDNSIKIKGLLNYIKEYGDNFIKAEWCLSKDDISPQELFDAHKVMDPIEGPKGRARIAKYCIMDCELCIHLLLLLDFIPNNMGMSNVCYVPQTFIFLRGQGIKVQSLVTKFCSDNNIRVPTLKQFKEEECDNSGFEGAIVLEPKTGIYLDDPIAVLDYASLYPTSIKEKNLSHDTYYGEWSKVKKDIENMGWIEEEDYNRIKYLDYKYEQKEGTKVIEKKEVMELDKYGKKILDDNGNEIHKKIDCVFLTNKRKQGIIPTVVSELLSARQRTKKLLKLEKDEDKKKVLDGFQLAYKLTANSVYGQLGAKTSSISFKKIAACTTAIGRDRIDDASRLVKSYAEDNGMFEPDVVYGDTDSIFVKFSRNTGGKVLKDKEALEYCIKCGIEAGKYITEHLHKENKEPQDLEYEKTFWPFILISKKRYTGEKYEYSSDFKDAKRTSMGIVTKRRDNAPIVKYVFGNLINKLMYDRNIATTKQWLEYILSKIVKGEEHMSMFILSKTLNSYYKNPDSIAHKVLADRIGRRDPGNKPKANDRIPYAYIEIPKEMEQEFIGYKMIPKKIPTGRKKMITKTIDNGFYKNGKPKTKKVRVEEGEEIFKTIQVPEGEPKYKKKNVLQGDRIEHPDYIIENNLKLDYRYYISNQIMNPVKQVLDITMSPEESMLLFNKFLKKDYN